MAGVNTTIKSLWPQGENSLFPIKVGGYAPNALNGVLDAIQLDFDCYVKKVDLTYTGGTNDVDALALVTVDDSRNIVDSADLAADAVAVTQTLNTNAETGITGYLISRGDKIQATVDASGTNESGHCMFTVWVKPAH